MSTNKFQMYLSRLLTKPTMWLCTQRRLRSAWASACPGWSESSLCAQWVAKGQSFLHVDSEDSDQTGRVSRLIWVFAGRTLTLLVLSRGGSFLDFSWKLDTRYIYLEQVHNIFSSSVSVSIHSQNFAIWFFE